MTELQNFLELVRFGAPERIPARIPDYGLHYRGCNHDDAEGHGHHSPVGTAWSDIWGTVWHKDLEGVMGFPRGFPLEHLEDLDDFVFPDPDDPAIHSQIYEQRAACAGDVLISAAHRDTLWERAYMLVGMENLMVYLHTEPDLVRLLLRRIMDFQLAMARHYAAAGCKIIYLSDDHGMQSSLLLGERVIRDFFVPEYRRLLDFYADKDVIVDFHSCGHIEPLIDVFIEMGIYILNPIQATANDLRRVRERTAGKLVLQGAIDSDVVLRGTPDRIRALVKERIELLGREGGYICSPDQSLGFPAENLKALNYAVEEYGIL